MRISDWSSDVCSSDLFLVAVDHHVITDAPRERRRFERGERGEDHRNARLHVGGAWAVEHPGFEPFERLERMVGGKHRVHMSGEQQLHRRRSEEHTSELQSLMRISYAVFCLKKKTHTDNTKVRCRKN